MTLRTTYCKPTVPMLILAMLFLNVQPLKGQKMELSLDKSIAIAISGSIAFLKAETSRETANWSYKTYRASLRPQLSLEGTLPFFRKENIPVFQQDGSILFRQVEQSQNMLNMSLTQEVALTGGQLFLSSDANRADNFSPNSTTYGVTPVLLGFRQPLFGFNRLKWAKQLAPVRYEEGRKEFVEEKENISILTTRYYFNWLLAQIDYEMATDNLEASTDLLIIGSKKHDLGQLSLNDKMQLELAKIEATKNRSRAELSKESASLQLKSYLGLDGNIDYHLRLPTQLKDIAVPLDQAITYANHYSQRSVEIKRVLMEAQQNAYRVKRESGLNASLGIKLGLNDVADNLPDAYTDMQNLQTFSLDFSIPIIDWGKQKAQKKVANANLKLAQYTYDQETINLRQQVVATIAQFEMVQSLAHQSKLADSIAQARYNIATKRYVLGDISITNLNIAQDQKDRTRRDYINALKSYWESYYLIRLLTLYDFENNIPLFDTEKSMKTIKPNG